MSNDSTPTILPGQYLTPERASEYLGDLGCPTTKAVLARLRTMGGGPKFVKFAPRKVAYSRKALEIWAAGKLTGELESTSQVPTSHVKKGAPGRPRKQMREARKQAKQMADGATA